MRTAEIKRKTKETDIEVFVKLDGEGKVSVNTGIGFFDHMLTALGVHSGIDMDVECTGDLYVDGHHTVEDVGICLGKAFAERKSVVQGKSVALGGRRIIYFSYSLIISL